MLPQSPTSGPVLGADVMAAVWNDMDHTVLPSWMTAVPKDWGTKRRGKLSADHWRTIFTVHLPITLIWIWASEGDRKRRLLSNMLDLVVAVRIANFKKTNANLAEQYDRHMSRYLDQVAVLFPEDNIVPNMHCALHIGDNLRNFGPSHSRGAQFYERYIHRLQRQNTNMKFGLYYWASSGCLSLINVQESLNQPSCIRQLRRQTFAASSLTILQSDPLFRKL